MTHDLIALRGGLLNRRRAFQWSAALCCAALGSTLAGCTSVGESSSGSFASVDIPHRSIEEIAATTVKTFRANGYSVIQNEPGDMIFEKPASGSMVAAYQSFGDMQSGRPALVRVKANVVPLANGSNRLACQAYMVTGGEDLFFQEAQALSRVYKGPYQTLLNQVAAASK